MRRLRLSLVAMIGSSLSMLMMSAALAGPTITLPSFPRLSSTSTPGATDPRIVVQGLKTRTVAAIDRRISFLDGLKTRVSASTTMEEDHRTKLLEKISTARSAMEGARTGVSDVDTLAAVRNYARDVVFKYRVFALIGPQVQLIATIDRQQELIKNANAFVSTAKERSAAVELTSADGKVIEAQISMMQANIDKATTELNGLADDILKLEASAYPGNRDQLLQARAALRASRSHLRDSVKSAKIVADLLKKAERSAPTTTIVTKQANP